MAYERTDELVTRILDGIIDGKSVRQICEEPGMPSRHTVQRWIAEDAEFAAKCARAREMQADNIFEEMQDVADNGNPDDVQRAKLRVSTMQWRAAKLAPKKYGDSVRAQVTGADGGPVQMVTEIVRKVVRSDAAQPDNRDG